jgi:chaperone modulatory protein CbpM
MADIVVLMTGTVVVEDLVSFTLPALCRASGADPAQVQALVHEGLLQPTGQGPQHWRFGGEALPQTRRALRLARDFELDLAAVGLVMDLLTEIERLRSSLRQRTVNP